MWMPARNKGADQTIQTNCESVRKSCCAAIEETGKTQEEFSVRSVLNVLQHCGIPHMIVCSEMLLCSEHGLCVAIRQPFAAADAAHTGPAPNPMQVWI